jgi:hypothetical protein
MYLINSLNTIGDFNARVGRDDIFKPAVEMRVYVKLEF